MSPIAGARDLWKGCVNGKQANGAGLAMISRELPLGISAIVIIESLSRLHVIANLAQALR